MQSLLQVRFGCGLAQTEARRGLSGNAQRGVQLAGSACRRCGVVAAALRAHSGLYCDTYLCAAASRRMQLAVDSCSASARLRTVADARDKSTKCMWHSSSAENIWGFAHIAGGQPPQRNYPLQRHVIERSRIFMFVPHLRGGVVIPVRTRSTTVFSQAM